MKKENMVLYVLAVALLTAATSTAQTQTEDSVGNPFRQGRYIWDANLSTV